jgi:hypothetical protein
MLGGNAVNHDCHVVLVKHKNRVSTMKKIVLSPVGMQMVWVGVCAALILASAFAQGYILMVLIAVAVVVMLLVAMNSRGKSWTAIRS